jgi:hypothetical protein
MGGVSPLRDLIWVRPVSILPDQMVTGRLWSTLSQLAHFGLAPTSPPLLERPDNKFSATSFRD